MPLPSSQYPSTSTDPIHRLIITLLNTANSAGFQIDTISLLPMQHSTPSTMTTATTKSAVTSTAEDKPNTNTTDVNNTKNPDPISNQMIHQQQTWPTVVFNHIPHPIPSHASFTNDTTSQQQLQQQMAPIHPPHPPHHVPTPSMNHPSQWLIPAPATTPYTLPTAPYPMQAYYGAAHPAYFHPPAAAQNVFWSTVMQKAGENHPSLAATAAFQHPHPHQIHQPPNLTSVGQPSSQPLSSQQQRQPSSSSTPTQKEFICPRCKSSFKTNSNMQKHIRTVHDNCRPFKCDRCTASYGHKNLLVEHIRTAHDGERPFVCDTCGARFGRSSNLYSHMKSHDGKREHKCETCHVSFSLHGNMVKHIKTVHLKQRPFVCPVCDSRFGLRSDLTRHARNVHRIMDRDLGSRRNSRQTRARIGSTNGVNTSRAPDTVGTTGSGSMSAGGSPPRTSSAPAIAGSSSDALITDVTRENGPENGSSTTGPDATEG